MSTCTACAEPIDGPLLSDDATGEAFHAACAMERLPYDALRALAELLAIVLVPPIVVWAG